MENAAGVWTSMGPNNIFVSTVLGRNREDVLLRYEDGRVLVTGLHLAAVQYEMLLLGAKM